MLLDSIYVVAGLALLAYAGNKLIDFSVAIAVKARLTPAVIGLTIVSAGTSAPELFVSATAALKGSPDIALANVVGSNIANVGLVLGACAVIAAVPINRGIFRLEYPFMILASWIALLLCRDLVLDRLESGFFFASLVGFAAYAVWLARQKVSEQEARALGEPVAAEPETLLRRPGWVLMLGLTAALAGLGIGARVLVAGAVHIAEALGISERLIGLTIVAIGTSLPELVASTAAALKKQHEMAVTNIVGSNIFNILLILGVTGLIRPIPVNPALVSLDMWVMLAIALLLFPLVIRDATLSRRDGLLFLVAYFAYLVFIARTG